MKITAISQATDGLTHEVADGIFDHMARFASYGFNKSHAAAYAAISFQTASLKAHHPECFYAASMNMAVGDIESMAIFAGELKTRKITLEIPDINTSDARFKPRLHNNKLTISYGLAAIRGVGKCAYAIEAERTENGPFDTFEIFRDRMGGLINKKALMSLIHSGAFDEIGFSRQDCAELAQEKRTTSKNQMSFFDDIELDTRTPIAEYDFLTKLSYEFDALGFWHSAHPLDGRGGDIKKKGLSSLRTLRQTTPLPKVAWLVGGVLDTDMRGTKSGGVMGIVTISDSIDVFEAVAFDETWGNISSVLKKQGLYAFQVTPSEDEGIVRLMIQKAVPLETHQIRKRA
jgi:DNA polymerase-3 subunit alpha